MILIQDETFQCSINADDKLMKLEPYSFTLLRRRDIDNPIDQIESSVFMSLNSSLGWLGLAASPICTFHASHPQQMLPTVSVAAVVAQSKAIRVPKRLFTAASYNRPMGGSLPLCVTVFADARGTSDHRKLSYVAVVVLGSLQDESLFHAISWSSHKSKSPVPSIGAAVILATSEAINKGKTIKTTLRTLLGFGVELAVLVDFKDLYNSLSTRRNSIDQPIHPDVNVIRL